MIRNLLYAVLLGLMATVAYLWPSDQISSQAVQSPLFAQSLDETKGRLVEPKYPYPEPDSKGAGPGNQVTCQLTCAATCTQPTCEATCAGTCETTCSGTCGQTTCTATCVLTCNYTCAYTCANLTCQTTCLNTCAATCYNTCSQMTCEATCFYTCGIGCPSSQITLVSFGAVAGTEEVILNWVTASEIDNYYFLIRRATDPDGEFEIIAQVPGNSSSTTTQHYSVTDFDVIPGVTYYYTLADISLSGAEVIHPVIVSATPTAAADFHLAQNYPNPFNRDTRIRINLPYAAQMKLSVYNVQGKMIKILSDTWTPAGPGEAIWDGTDLRGYAAPSGTYFYYLNAGDLSAMGKMVLLR